MIEAEVREGIYGSKIATIEPGGAEYIPLSERHGKPYRQFWTWVSPNMEFATDLRRRHRESGSSASRSGWPRWPSCWAPRSALSPWAVLAARGPRYGVPQMVLSRICFGFFGNILPAGINALVAGVGWFAVNSVSGAFALNALLGWNAKVCLLIIVVVQIAVAFFGHNLVHAFERSRSRSWSSSS